MKNSLYHNIIFPKISPNLLGQPEQTGNPLPTIIGDYSIPRGWPQQPYFNPPGGPPGPPAQWGEPITNEDVQAGYGYLSNGLEERDLYFYHPDHLGSTSIITDRNGIATQFVAYMPFGESFVDEHTSSWESQYKFNGKELDAETGLYYYGARYYDPKTSLWYGVDMLTEKYPNVGGYVYCVGNPIKYIDSDGRKIFIAGSAEFKKTTFNDMQKLSSSNLIMLKSGQVVEAAGYKGAQSNIVLSGTASGGKKEFGTGMIHDLSSNEKHTVTIKQVSGENDNYRPTNNNYANAQNPDIGSGGTIEYDPNSRGYDIVNKDRTTGVDAYITLGHELIHADKAMKGEMKSTTDKAKIDPDGLPNVHRKISSEEVDTRQKENVIRGENKVKLRAEP